MRNTYRLRSGVHIVERGYPGRRRRRTNPTVPYDVRADTPSWSGLKGTFTITITQDQATITAENVGFDRWIGNWRGFQKTTFYDMVRTLGEFMDGVHGSTVDQTLDLSNSALLIVSNGWVPLPMNHATSGSKHKGHATVKRYDTPPLSPGTHHVTVTLSDYGATTNPREGSCLIKAGIVAINTQGAQVIRPTRSGHPSDMWLLAPPRAPRCHRTNHLKQRGEPESRTSLTDA